MDSSTSNNIKSPAREPISSLFVLKAFLSFTIVTMHSPLALPYLKIPGFEVDIFFMITGYFLYHRDKQVVFGRIKKSLGKLILPIIALQLIYYPFSHVTEGITEAPVTYLRWLFLGFPTFNSGPLWYLNAVFYGLITLGVLMKLLGWERFNKYCIGLFVLTLGTMYLQFYRPFFSDKQTSMFVFNFLTRAVPFLSVGYWIKINELRLSSGAKDGNSHYRWLLAYIVIVFLGMIEGLVVGSLSDGRTIGGFMNYAVAPICLFMVALSFKSFGKSTVLEAIGREYSGNIYYGRNNLSYLGEYDQPCILLNPCDYPSKS